VDAVSIKKIIYYVTYTYYNEIRRSLIQIELLDEIFSIGDNNIKY